MWTPERLLLVLLGVCGLVLIVQADRHRADMATACSGLAPVDLPFPSGHREAWRQARAKCGSMAPDGP